MTGQVAQAGWASGDTGTAGQAGRVAGGAGPTRHVGRVTDGATDAALGRADDRFGIP